MTLKTFLNQVTKIQPRYLHDLAHLGTIRRVGSGAYRQAYTIGNLPVIVKFPFDEKGRVSGYSYRQSIMHTRYEIRALDRVMSLKKFRHLRRFMPKVYYYSAISGIVIVKRYKLCEDGCPMALDLGQLLTVAFAKEWDDNFDNFGYEIGPNGTKRPKVLDLGVLLHGFQGYKCSSLSLNVDGSVLT